MSELMKQLGAMFSADGMPELGPQAFVPQGTQTPNMFQQMRALAAMNMPNQPGPNRVSFTLTPQDEANVRWEWQPQVPDPNERLRHIGHGMFIRAMPLNPPSVP